MAGDVSLRLDKWLWYARFFKTRTAATKLIQSGKLRIDGNVNHKPHRAAIIGMVLTFPKANDIRVIKIVQLGERRGPAGEALSLYEDLSPKINETKKEEPLKVVNFEIREIGAGRPTKKQRRETERLKDRFAK